MKTINKSINEDFYPIPGYENLYEISESGVVRSLKFGAAKQIKQNTYRGFKIVTLKNNKNQRQRVYINKIISMLFKEF